MKRHTEIMYGTKEEMIASAIEHGVEPGLITERDLEPIEIDGSDSLIDPEQYNVCEFPDSSDEEIDENAEFVSYKEDEVELFCPGGQVGSGAKWLGVNKSGAVINVRAGASTGHSVLGKLYDKESFTFTGTTKSDGSYTWYWIEFLSPSGRWTAGWYRGYNGVGYWKNNPYMTISMTNSTFGHNFRAKAYKVMSRIQVINGDDNAWFFVNPGNYLLCKSDSSGEFAGKTGTNIHTALLCHGVRYMHGSFADDEIIGTMDGGLFGQSGYGKLGLDVNSRSPRARGNW